MKVESSARAVCNFCSRSDNSIQVICEAKCLLCSRCQIVPGIRKLLIEHSSITDLYITPENLFCVPINSATLTRKGFCPICEHPMSPSMLVLIEMFKESMRGANEDELAATGVRHKGVSTYLIDCLKFISCFD